MTLALGIAANTSIFSVVNGLFLRAMPGVRNPETLVEVSRGPGFVSVSHPVFEHFRDNAPGLEQLAAFDVVGLALSAGQSEVVMGLQVGGNYFDVLGTRPAAGRFILGAERSTTPGGALVGLGLALLTSRFLEAFLFGVDPLDPLTFAGVVGVLGSISILANLAPALRATRLDPVTVLRAE